MLFGHPFQLQKIHKVLFIIVFNEGYIGSSILFKILLSHRCTISKI